MISVLVGFALAAPPSCDEREEADKQAVSAVLSGAYDRLVKGTPGAELVGPVRSIDKRGAICSGEDAYHAAAILQTTYEVKILERAHELAKLALKKRARGANELVASTYDRWMTAQNLGQRYGTQTATKKGKPCLFAMGESPADDAERAKFGLGPLAERYAEILGHGGLYDEIVRSDQVCDPVKPVSAKAIAKQRKRDAKHVREAEKEEARHRAEIEKSQPTEAN